MQQNRFQLLALQELVLPALRLAYVTHGRLAPDGRNAVLLTHGYTSSHHMVDAADGGAEGCGGPDETHHGVPSGLVARVIDWPPPAF